MKEYIIGHRGAGYLAPENTIYALEKAAELGLSRVECDVRLTKDNVLVLSHDESLSRCANVNRNISEMNYEELRYINVAKYHALCDVEVPPPTLKEFMNRADELGIACQVELKSNDGDEALLAREMFKFLEDKENKNPALITSFSVECLKNLEISTQNRCETGLLVKKEENYNWRPLADDAECDFVHIHGVCLHAELAKDIKSCGYRINCYHLNHPMLAKNAIDLGCEGFTCDVPDILLDAT